MVGEELRAFTVRIDPATYRSAKALAAMTERTLGQLVNDALIEFLGKRGLEEHLDALLEEARSKLREATDD